MKLLCGWSTVQRNILGVMASFMTEQILLLQRKPVRNNELLDHGLKASPPQVETTKPFVYVTITSASTEVLREERF